MGSVGDLIGRHHAEILERWTEFARQSAFAQGLTPPELASMMPAYLSSLGSTVSDDASGLSNSQQELIERHLSSRLRQGSVLNEILTEFALLGRCITRIIDSTELAERPSVPEVARLFSELYLTSTAVTTIFDEHLLEDEQTEKRYRRLLQHIATDGLAIRPHHLGAPLRTRLTEVLDLIMKAMDARTAALLIYDAKSNGLIMSASTGDAQETLEQFVSSDLTTVAGKIASTNGRTTIADVETTELEVSDTLRRSGIHSLLGVPLGAHHLLRGVIYIGIRQKRKFTASEIRRLEGLSETLAVHLDNGKLHTALEEKVEQLATEDLLRERYISVLMHDLTGPLGAARASARSLGEPGKGIVRELERMEKMVSALLDTHRIRAGHRLSIDTSDCDLVDIARAAVDELRATYGDRVSLHADKHARGMWNPDQLRRAIWNLALNGLQHGSEQGTVVVTVKPGKDRQVVTVHNHGPEIPAADQARLFQPFSTDRTPIAGHPRGWGLGLTLVWGCAEAHGGAVSVESKHGKGTTFALSLPIDARPYAD